MKNKIEYYYQLININLSEKNNIYTFNYNDKKYKFFICNRNIEELREIYLILSSDNKYNKIILNRNKEITTYIDNNQYILVQEKQYLDNEYISFNDLLNKKQINYNYKNSILNREDWYNLWTKKIDYIVYQREHISNEYPILNQYLDYFIGLSENAISYFKDTIETEKGRDQYVLSHRRIKSLLKKDFYNIDDLIIDHPIRDISEYFKYIFFANKVDYNLISLIIKKINLSNYGYRLLFARMLFPTYFFDEYEKIVNEKLEEKQINTILLKIPDYELYLKFIYTEINKKTKIPNIDWLS